MSEIATIHRADSVKIVNENDKGDPLSIQIPADMIFKVDAVFREMSYRGKESPELRVYRTEGGTGMTMWAADYGGYHGWSVTPWGAMEDLGRRILKEKI